MRTSIKKGEIKMVNKGRLALRTEFFLVKARQTELSVTRTAFAFSRKAGNAVTRNLFKRRIRAIVMSVAPKDTGQDLFFIARRPFKGLSRALWHKEKSCIRKWFEGYQPIHPVAP
ncbi:MAG: ribonuclease P protein component [Deltaproteobacteria bacterium]|nr:ribonuclease P protein component [Deltaproteobacteria bacterium]